ncbi:MAG: hypothetical protein SGPRY_014608 [Prymnesium sp.]
MATTPILGRVASIMVLINGFFSIPVWMRPVERITLEWFGREARHVAESAKGQRLLVMVRMGLLVGAVIITSRVPSFGAAISLMGGFSAALTSIVLPVTFYYMVHQETLQSWQKWLCWLAIFLGLTALLVGLSSLFGSTWMLIARSPCYTSPSCKRRRSRLDRACLRSSCGEPAASIGKTSSRYSIRTLSTWARRRTQPCKRQLHAFKEPPGNADW